MKHGKMIVAITGGIGSGKSHVCSLLSQYGINVYDCDAAAKRLMREDQAVQTALQQLVGHHVYKDHQLQKAVLAQFLLISDKHKQAVNDIVHPAVASDFLQSDYQWIESAILFDAHFDRRICPDYVICVTAPLAVRMERIMQRDQIGCEQAMQWIQMQLPQEETCRLSDFEIVNDGKTCLQPQIKRILKQLSEGGF